MKRFVLRSLKPADDNRLFERLRGTPDLAGVRESLALLRLIYGGRRWRRR